MLFKKTRRYTREEACLAASASLEQLEALEEQRLLTPRTDIWPPWQPHQPYYDEVQVGILSRVRFLRRDSNKQVRSAWPCPEALEGLTESDTELQPSAVPALMERCGAFA